MRVGSRVRIELHGRRVGGWVVADPSQPPSSVRVRALAGVSGWGPPPAVIEVARWAAWRWAGPLTAFLRTASPPRNVPTLPEPPALPEPPGGPGRSAGGNDRPRGAPGDVASAPGAVPVERALVERALVERVLVERVLRRTDRPTTLRIAPDVDLLPLVESVIRWAAAAEPVAEAVADQLADRAGDRGAVLVLVPNVGWAERLAARLRRRGIAVAGDWERAAAGWPVVVGARSAAWAPARRLAAAVVLDAHDEAYRDERAPTANAWEIVAERARRDGAPCLLVTPCPTVVQLDRTELEVGSRSAERAGWPALVVVDRREADPRQGLLSGALAGAAHEVLNAGAPAVFVLNRTGRARLLACAACGDLVRCEHCGHALHQADEELTCPSCRRHRPVVCASCGATRLRLLRPGTARLREELEALLRVAVVEVAGPRRRPGAGAGGSEEPAGSEDRASVAVSEDARAFIGTEAVLHRVRRAGLVAFLDFDQHLLASRFAGAEEALALLARAGRLVGGRGTRWSGTTGPVHGRVLVQTRLPDHAVVRAALEGDPGILAAQEASLRHELSLPPNGALALVSGAGAEAFGDALRARGATEVADLGDGRHMVRAATTAGLCDALAAVPRPPGRLRVEVDPTAL